MIIRHATMRANLASIQRHGLLPSCTKQGRQEVWLHSKSLTPKLIIHTLDRHKCELADIVVLEVSVPREWLKTRGKGIWRSPVAIVPARIKAVIEAKAFIGVNQEEGNDGD